MTVFFVKALTFALNEQEGREARESINRHYFNDPGINVLNADGTFTGKYDSHPEFPKVQDAHARTHAIHVVYIRYSVGIDGVPVPLKILTPSEICDFHKGATP